MKTATRTPLLAKLLTQLPLFFSAIALVLSFLGFQLTAVRSVKPVLAITYRGQAGWFIKNIGNGPAFNVLVAKKGQADWFEPVRTPPLGVGEEMSMQWLDQISTLATFAR